ncbi:hypothetical protein [Oceanibium sediminis]|uniref:hypothetical protein n=1 Tax=Oceanibium sediminis TaxID=2026339 RepID=UPI001E6520CB|nr:hypothetical protein [Oceanibium sediminis]
MLRLAGKVQHELACSACGARLHTMKALPVSTAAKPKARSPQRPAPHRPAPRQHKPQGKRRSPLKRFADLFEDILDEVEDIFD